MMVTVILMLTLNNDDDINRQHILGIGRHHQFLYMRVVRGRQDLCTQCLLDSIISLFLHYHLQ